ncbi:hypothetical protein [Halomonas binhaiensis]|uniref:Uncharacterized protein n=1 Tax=Halomonas binhaiensis TaxID=2562282 RepID=A0A5C1NF76_9GAMM|nr:hypothetical protein [Halomonas binhaiensis]QEM80915.1 hypothetical protein E4T21_04625 [Halomonas binhaiensis]
MGFNYTLVNNTNSTVTFGLWNATGDHSEVHKVDNSEQKKESARYSDARTVAAWLDDGNLYPNNQSPYLAGGYFMDGGNYTITLSDQNITITQS